MSDCYANVHGMAKFVAEDKNQPGDCPDRQQKKASEKALCSHCGYRSAGDGVARNAADIFAANAEVAQFPV